MCLASIFLGLKCDEVWFDFSVQYIGWWAFVIMDNNVQGIVFCIISVGGCESPMAKYAIRPHNDLRLLIDEWNGRWSFSHKNRRWQMKFQSIRYRVAHHQQQKQTNWVDVYTLHEMGEVCVWLCIDRHWTSSRLRGNKFSSNLPTIICATIDNALIKPAHKLQTKIINWMSLRPLAKPRVEERKKFELILWLDSMTHHRYRTIDHWLNEMANDSIAMTFFPIFFPSIVIACILFIRTIDNDRWDKFF